MHPNGEELLRGLQGTLATYVMPEVQTPHARLEIGLVQAMLGIAAAEWDGAAQRLVDDNASLRDLARRGPEALAGSPEAAALADELRTLAEDLDPSVRLSDLSAANNRLRDALERLCALAQESGSAPLRTLRSSIIDHFRRDAEERSLSLLGPRSDG